MKNSKKKMDIFFDHKAPSIVFEIPAYKNGYQDIIDRGGKIRAVTEITRDNVEYCKELAKMADLRHLEGIKGGLAVNESEYMATTVLEEAKPLTEVVYSNVRELVEQGQYFFDIIWSKAILAEQRFQELEDGIAIHPETKVLERWDEISNQITLLTASSSEILIVSAIGGMKFIYDNFFDSYRRAIERFSRDSNSRGIRWVLTLDGENVDIVKAFQQEGVQIRHARNLGPINFAVGNKILNATIDEMKGGRIVQSLLTSNEPAYVNHFRSIFEKVWSEGIEIEDRIGEIREGKESAEIEIISNPKEAIFRAWKMVGSAEKEVLLLFSTADAFQKQMSMGGLYMLEKAIENHPSITVRILVPAGDDIQYVIDLGKKMMPKIDLRVINQKLKTSISILIVDGKECIIFELRDNVEKSSLDSIGTTMFSPSPSIVSSYYAIVQSLWHETELYEKLKVHDKLQKEFINIAAHELRTPIQPILGLTELLYSNSPSDPGEQKQMLGVILRNAIRLQRLTDDILDVARIESQSFRLNTEKFDLVDVALTIIEDAKADVKNRDLEISLDIGQQVLPPSQTFESAQPDQKPTFAIVGDKYRLGQILYNIMNNAIKFTEKGRISVLLHNLQDNVKPAVEVQVIDTGTGIHPEIMPRLFEKFATKSDNGTGLGLFISKAIVEAHGGRIWAQNNANGSGATFSFTIPTSP